MILNYSILSVNRIFNFKNIGIISILYVIVDTCIVFYEKDKIRTFERILKGKEVELGYIEEEIKSKYIHLNKLNNEKIKKENNIN